MNRRRQIIAQLLGVVRFILEALQTNVPVTKRDIYYRDVALFQKQANVDTLVDDLAATLGVTRHDLNVRASSKGLFCGSALSIRLRDNTMIAGHDNQAFQSPFGEDIEGLIVDEDIRWVLLVEKEGKGYPDVATRQLVHKLSIGLPERIPIFALVDADPYGIDIMACYSFGSESLDHERESLVSERVICIGVLLSELQPRQVPCAPLRPSSYLTGLGWDSFTTIYND
ncbi:DNA topoisomerase IV, alpha subunit [Serendipita vermifera]|nr:DNA topoisomerase IV, alpha subunit [Serendipita vermifera]